MDPSTFLTVSDTYFQTMRNQSFSSSDTEKVIRDNTVQPLFPPLIEFVNKSFRFPSRRQYAPFVRQITTLYSTIYSSNYNFILSNSSTAISIGSNYDPAGAAISNAPFFNSVSNVFNSSSNTYSNMTVLMSSIQSNSSTSATFNSNTFILAATDIYFLNVMGDVVNYPTADRFPDILLANNYNLESSNAMNVIRASNTTALSAYSNPQKTYDLANSAYALSLRANSATSNDADLSSILVSVSNAYTYDYKTGSLITLRNYSNISLEPVVLSTIGNIIDCLSNAYEYIFSNALYLFATSILSNSSNIMKSNAIALTAGLPIITGAEPIITSKSAVILNDNQQIGILSNKFIQICSNTQNDINNMINVNLKSYIDLSRTNSTLTSSFYGGTLSTVEFISTTQSSCISFVNTVQNILGYVPSAIYPTLQNLSNYLSNSVTSVVCTSNQFTYSISSLSGIQSTTCNFGYLSSVVTRIASEFMSANRTYIPPTNSNVIILGSNFLSNSSNNADSTKQFVIDGSNCYSNAQSFVNPTIATNKQLIIDASKSGTTFGLQRKSQRRIPRPTPPVPVPTTPYNEKYILYLTAYNTSGTIPNFAYLPGRFNARKNNQFLNGQGISPYVGPSNFFMTYAWEINTGLLTTDGSDVVLNQLDMITIYTSRRNQLYSINSSNGLGNWTFYGRADITSPVAINYNSQYPYYLQYNTGYGSNIGIYYIIGRNAYRQYSSNSYQQYTFNSNTLLPTNATSPIFTSTMNFDAIPANDLYKFYSYGIQNQYRLTYTTPLLHFGLLNGQLITLDSVSGRQLWSAGIQGPVTCTPLVGISGLIYVSDQAGSMIAFNGEGQQVWKTAYLNGDLWSAGAVTSLGNRIFFGTSNPTVSGSIYCLDGPTGQIVWTFSNVIQNICSVGGLSKDEMYYVVGDTAGNVYILNVSDGTLAKQSVAGRSNAPLVIDDDTVYLFGNSNLAKLRIASGTEFTISNYTTSNATLTPFQLGPGQQGVLDTTGTYFTSDDSGRLIAMNLYPIESQGQNYYYSYVSDASIGRIKTPAINSQGFLICTSANGKITAFSDKSQYNSFVKGELATVLIETNSQNYSAETLVTLQSNYNSYIRNNYFTLFQSNFNKELSNTYDTTLESNYYTLLKPADLQLPTAEYNALLLSNSNAMTALGYTPPILIPYYRLVQSNYNRLVQSNYDTYAQNTYIGYFSNMYYTLIQSYVGPTITSNYYSNYFIAYQTVLNTSYNRIIQSNITAFNQCDYNFLLNAFSDPSLPDQHYLTLSNSFQDALNASYMQSLATAYANTKTTVADIRIVQSIRQPGAWRQFLNCQGISPYTGPYNFFKSVAWTHASGIVTTSGVHTVLDQSNGNVVYVGGGTSLLAINAVLGTRLWSYTTSGPIFGTPAVSLRTNNIYISTDDGKVVALNKNSGAVLWTYAPAPAVSFKSHPAIDVNEVVYVSDSNGSMYSIDGFTGALNWKYTYNDGNYSAGAVIDRHNNIYFGVSNGNRPGPIISLTSIGTLRWIYTTTSGGFNSVGALTNDDIFFLIGDGSYIYRIFANGPFAGQLRSKTASSNTAPILVLPNNRCISFGTSNLSVFGFSNQTPYTEGYTDDTYDYYIPSYKQSNGTVTQFGTALMNQGVFSQNGYFYTSDTRSGLLTLDINFLFKPLVQTYTTSYTPGGIANPVGTGCITVNGYYIVTDSTGLVTAYSSASNSDLSVLSNIPNTTASLNGLSNVASNLLVNQIYNSAWKQPLNGQNRSQFQGPRNLNGAPKWQRTLLGTGTLSNGSHCILDTIDNTTVYTSFKDTVYAINGNSGLTNWTYIYPTGSITTPVALNSNVENVYFGTDDGSVVSLTRSGVFSWKYTHSVANPVTAYLAVGANNSVYAGFNNPGTVIAFDSVTGLVRWKTTLPQPILNGPVINSANQLFLGTSLISDTAGAGMVFAIDGGSGSILWSNNLLTNGVAAVGGFTDDQQLFFIGDTSSNMWGFYWYDGFQQYYHPGGYKSAPIMVNNCNILVFGDQSLQEIVLVDDSIEQQMFLCKTTDSNIVYQFSTATEQSGLIDRIGNVYLSDDSGNLFTLMVSSLVYRSNWFTTPAPNYTSLGNFGFNGLVKSFALTSNGTLVMADSNRRITGF